MSGHMETAGFAEIFDADQFGVSSLLQFAGSLCDVIACGGTDECADRTAQDLGTMAAYMLQHARRLYDAERASNGAKAV